MSNRATPIRIALVEDDQPVREGLRNLINETPGYNCVADFESGELALRGIPKLDLDVVLMDIQLPGMSGISCIAGLAELVPDVEIMMLTVFEDHDRILQSLKAGANGYLLKHTPRNKLFEAISDLHRGESPISPEIARRVVDVLRQSDPILESMAPLSPREREILDRLARGLTYKEIAATLGISVETIRTHIHNIYKKLQVRSRTEAVMKVFGNLRP